MGGKAPRLKGHSWEREVANDLKDAGFTKAKRLLEYQEGVGVDIENAEPFAIQCKNLAKPPSFNKMLEYMDEVQLPGWRLLALKVTRKGEYAIMEWEDLMALIQDWQELRHKLKK